LSLPITGISFEQAVKFCKWKEQLFNSDRADNKKIKIELPSIDIYKRIIENFDSLCTSCSDPCMRFRFNYKHPPCHSRDLVLSSQGQTLLRVDSYGPTRLKLYGIQGNAAEMTASNGVAMGGSFAHYANQSANSETQPYAGPERWLGFRYVVSIRDTPTVN
jgi:hypothetical protein